MNIDHIPDKAQRILKALAANPKTRQMAAELAGMINDLMIYVSEMEMRNEEMTWNYNDLRDGTIQFVKKNQQLAKLIRDARPN